MNLCYFVSDLHGDRERYRKLLDCMANERPSAVFMGGDLTGPLGMPLIPQAGEHGVDSLNGGLVALFRSWKGTLKQYYPKLFVILGNDDPRTEESVLIDAASQGYCEYVHNRKASFEEFTVYGYSHVPPTPFLNKDWERYDVSRYVDPGSVSPETGGRTVPVSASKVRHTTIKNDLEALVRKDNLENAILLFHSPPYKTKLDIADLLGKKVDHVPLDIHVGSIAIERFLRAKKPRIALHGHVHESPRLSGSWQDRIGRTFLFSAAHVGPELALVRFSPHSPHLATRDLI